MMEGEKKGKRIMEGGENDGCRGGRMMEGYESGEGRMMGR